eukprot:NODE_6876_length_527_cov_23.401674_g6446_i0.p1 GENE.NODE_6876_length_527_cov_23.401674_g6446_i0~~NODE_6876_length_527_cov_23.401674_g6446_i0.p1  ORF type:complete len:107 (+),score=9.03 NODE_6876_length_527_cov_23.401674_g6446_i0:186-506(+)
MGNTRVLSHLRPIHHHRGFLATRLLDPLGELPDDELAWKDCGRIVGGLWKDCCPFVASFPLFLSNPLSHFILFPLLLLLLSFFCTLIIQHHSRPYDLATLRERLSV